MMQLDDLLKNLTFTCMHGTLNREVSAVCYDSRRVEKDCLFICIVGNNFDGHSVVDEVIAKGASVLVVSKEIKLPETADVTVIQVEDTRYAMAFISAAWFGNPADKLTVIGITGTKGKTTTTYLVKSILEQAGRKVGLIGTIEIVIGEEHIAANNTTPESYLLQSYFAKMADAGCDTVVMEVSSQGLMMHRTQGFVFDIGIFTNLEPDHIGPTEHKDFDDYLNCKAMLFKQCKLGILNGDDSHVQDILKEHTCEVELFGFKPGLEVSATDVSLYRENGELGVRFTVTGEAEFEVKLPTPGRFSVYNALTAVAVCRHFAVPVNRIQEALRNAHVKGRIEMVKVSDKFSLMIDYAHNAMSLESLLTTLKEYQPNRLICLFGCGGNRSRARRFEMGKVSGMLADLTIITSDNPRYEEPMDIIADIRSAVEETGGAYVEIANRKEAIAYAIHNGQEGDIIVLAGKGHEDYQEIKGVKYPMDERVLIAEILKENATSSKS